MKYYKDPDDNLFAFEDNVDKDAVARVENIHKTTLTEVSKSLYLEIVQEEKLKNRPMKINNAIENLLDTKAKELRYDSIMSARSYAGYANPFQSEAVKLAVWASNCWLKAGEIEADVKAGNREMPTAKEVLAELPKYEG